MVSKVDLPVWTESVPYNEPAELAALGAMFKDRSAYIQLSTYLKPEDFFLVRHAMIMQAIGRIIERGDAVDILTLSSQLSITGHLEEIGGTSYLANLLINTPHVDNADVYGQLVQRAALRRRLMVAADDMKVLALNEDMELGEVIRNAQSAFLDVTGAVYRKHGTTVKGLMHKLMDEVESRMEKGDTVYGLSTGLHALNQLIDGLESERLYIVAGRPGMGKSALVLSLALAIAEKGGRVGFFPNEMTEKECSYRMAAMKAGIPVRYLKRPGLMSPTQYSRFVSAVGEISQLPIFIEDTRLTPSQVQGKAEWLQRTDGLDVIIGDGAYRMPCDGNYREPYQRYSEISESLKGMARDLKVPVLFTHQLNRNCETRADKRPILSDLAESGRFEQDADVILFIYRDVVYNSATEFPNVADLICAKNRDGQTGVASVYFDKSITKFTDGTNRKVELRDGTAERIEPHDA